MKYLSIDTEITGLDPAVCELLEVGIVVFDSNEKFVQTNKNSLRIVLVRDTIQGDVFAINMNIKLIQEMMSVAKEFDLACADEIFVKESDTVTTWYLDMRSKTGKDLERSGRSHSMDVYYQTSAAKNTVIPPCFTNKLVEFLNNAEVNTGKLNIAGKNFSSFDAKFLEKYYAFKTAILDRARHRVLDIGSMYVTKGDSFIPDLKHCLERAGLNNEVPHTAVEDAVLVVKAAQFKFGV
jgi:DNA polymerase III epsilon subunit-like protein